MLYSFLVVVDALLALAVIVLILVNRGQGAEVGAAFGGSSSASVFGSKGAAPFITKVIAVLAALFFLNSLSLAYLANVQYVKRSVVDTFDVDALQKSEESIDSADDDVPDDADVRVPDVPN